jgi:hypothetical protein
MDAPLSRHEALNGSIAFLIHVVHTFYGLFDDIRKTATLSPRGSLLVCVASAVMDPTLNR